MGIGVENVGTPASIVEVSTYTMTGAETITITNANMLIVQVMTRDGSPTISSITHNGKPLSELAAHGWAVGPRTFTWGRVNPDVGTYDIVITFSQAVKGIACALGLTGVNTTNPVGATAGVSGGPDQVPSVDITTLYDNSWIVSHVGEAWNHDFTPDPSQTQRWELIVGGAPVGRKSGNGTTEHKKTAGSDTQLWTAADYKEWSVTCVEIRAYPVPVSQRRMALKPTELTGGRHGVDETTGHRRSVRSGWT